MKQEMMGWQWHQLEYMQSFALCSRQIIMPALRHSISSWCPTNSVRPG